MLFYYISFPPSFSLSVFATLGTERYPTLVQYIYIAVIVEGWEAGLMSPVTISHLNCLANISYPISDRSPEVSLRAGHWAK